MRVRWLLRVLSPNYWPMVQVRKLCVDMSIGYTLDGVEELTPAKRLQKVFSKNQSKGMGFLRKEDRSYTGNAEERLNSNTQL